ncbi:Golgin sub A member 2 [Thoreauomyces humboldtii]|nr:Golgin sub A member 2 [Thoreauomyces humboldtii]
MYRTSLQQHESDGSDDGSESPHMEGEEDDELKEESKAPRDPEDEDDAGDVSYKPNAEFLKKENEYIRLNKEIQSKSERVLKSVEDVVKEGRATLVRPVTAPSISGAAEPEEEQSTADLGPGDAGPDDGLGAEASARLLRAKLHVMQQDMGKLVRQDEAKTEQIKTLTEKLNHLDQTHAKLLRSQSVREAQSARSATLLEDMRRRAEEAESELATVRKQVDALGRAQRGAETDGNAKDVRLNRALDEIERLKGVASSASSATKEKLEEALRTNEKLLQDHRRVQKQKTELLIAFKKQSQLVDVLKRQKLHLESAKLLDIAEQDFVRALNWDV